MCLQRPGHLSLRKPSDDMVFKSKQVRNAQQGRQTKPQASMLSLPHVQPCDRRHLDMLQSCGHAAVLPSRHTARKTTSSRHVCTHTVLYSHA